MEQSSRSVETVKILYITNQIKPNRRREYCYEYEGVSGIFCPTYLTSAHLSLFPTQLRLILFQSKFRRILTEGYQVLIEMCF